jgi:hypothetical protein
MPTQLLDTTRFPILDLLQRKLRETGCNVKLAPCQQGIEIQFHNEIKGLRNRANLRIFFPAETKCVLFFYKKSSIPFSRDRFSYGGIVMDARSTGRFDEQDIHEWIEFLVGGLQPGSRPSSLKKSIPYTIPED